MDMPRTGTVAPVAVGVVDEKEPKNVIQWGPIIAGVVTAIAVMIVLTVLGLAVGASSLKPRDSGQAIGTFAGIWGGISALIAFFLGGLVSAKSASVAGKGSALLNGFMVGAAVLLLVLYLTGSGVGNLFGTVGSNIGDIANLVQEQADQQDVSTQDAQQQAEQAANQARANADKAFDAAKDAAWGTLAGLIIALAAATVGGLAGANSQRDLRERAVI